MIATVDEFILYDDMQYPQRDGRNRNQIKTPQGVQWTVYRSAPTAKDYIEVQAFDTMSIKPTWQEFK